LSIPISISKHQTETSFDFWNWNKSWSLLSFPSRIGPGTGFLVLFLSVELKPKSKLLKNNVIGKKSK
jgi:hypothetical protein